MEREEVLAQATRILTRLQEVKGGGGFSGIHTGLAAEVAEFLRAYAGAQSSFYKGSVALKGSSDLQLMNGLRAIMSSFINYVESGLHTGVSPERRAQLDVVSDFLEQAGGLLNQRGVHPAAPAVLIGATLEEYLRTWVEGVPLSLGSRKPSLQAYMEVLRDADLITKQDSKDITSWAGIRNHAAHGEWEEVDDKRRVSLMLEGVNLFMRRYGA